MAAGEFVCEYTGEILRDADVEAPCPSSTGRDAYLFDLTTARICRACGALPVEDPRMPLDDDDPMFVIDAFAYGNVGRFINHACGPSSAANISPVFVFTMERDS